MASELSPEDLTRLRVDSDTKYEFLIEHNVLDESESASREDIRDGITDLTNGERRMLDARLYERRERLERLLDGDREDFDEPRVTVEDLDDDTVWAWSN